jgi:hypothetical protein
MTRGTCPTTAGSFFRIMVRFPVECRRLTPKGVATAAIAQPQLIPPLPLGAKLHNEGLCQGVRPVSFATNQWHDPPT